MTIVDPADLPAVITRYLDAQRSRTAGAVADVFTPDAVVVDDGRTYTGADEVTGWLGSAAAEFTYTTTLTAARRDGDAHYVVVNHLEGDFPGGQADLNFRFTLRDGRIAALTIEP